MFIKKYLLSLLLFTLSYAQADLFTPNYSFIDTSINYIDWSSKTQEKTYQKDFTYLEVEGGVGWNWGEFYGFADVENPTYSYNDTPADDLRFILKPILDLYLTNNFALHIQDFSLKSKTFYVNNFATGISYLYKSDYGVWFSPFLAAHYQTSTYYSGLNGYIFGWALNYDFTLYDEKFKLFNWNEIEFARDKESYQLDDGTAIGDGKSYGVNGAVSIWWEINSHFTPGLQYRYAKYKLGSSVYQSGLIYSLKYFY